METKGVKTLFISVWLFLLFGCEVSQPYYYESVEPIEFELNVGLPKTGDYYHLTLNDNSLQTTHRISGNVFRNGMPVDVVRFEWLSSHYWYVGDTLGYIIKRNFNMDGQYVSYDTTYLTQFSGLEVPTSNQISYSNSKGEFNNMIAPVKTMVGDTMKLTATWYDGYTNFFIVLD